MQNGTIQGEKRPRIMSAHTRALRSAPDPAIAPEAWAFRLRPGRLAFVQVARER